MEEREYNNLDETDLWKPEPGSMEETLQKIEEDLEAIITLLNQLVDKKNL